MLLVYAYSPFVYTYTLKVNIKVITIDRNIYLSVYIWSTNILYEHTSNVTFWWRKNVDCHHRLYVALSVMTYHFEADAKAVQPNRNIVFSLWWSKNVGHHIEPSLIVTLPLIVVIDHTIFLTRRVFIQFITIDVKYGWYNMGYSPPNYSYMKMFIDIFLHCSRRKSLWLPIRFTPIPTCFLYKNLIYSLNISFAHHICCCYIFCNHFNCLIEENSQLKRFFTWHILTVDTSVN